MSCRVACFSSREGAKCGVVVGGVGGGHGVFLWAFVFPTMVPLSGFTATRTCFSLFQCSGVVLDAGGGV